MHKLRIAVAVDADDSKLIVGTVVASDGWILDTERQLEMDIIGDDKSTIYVGSEILRHSVVTVTDLGPHEQDRKS